MRIPSETLQDLLTWPELIEAIRLQFKNGCEVPERHHHTIKTPGQSDATMLLMPAWQPGNRIGIKLVNVFPDNTQKGLPSISADYLLYDGQTGQSLATMDGSVLTSRRTAAASALGARFLSREDSETIFLVGAGRVATLVPEAMRSVRSIKTVLIWDLNREGAERAAKYLRGLGFDANVELDLRKGTEHADIISCATLAKEPLIKGDWLKPGQHLDLIGSFTPNMRETDDDAMRIADVFVDTDTALTESGDLVRPLNSGAISSGDILANLTDLCTGRAKGRSGDQAITLFKAVGTALEDLAGASLAFDKMTHGDRPNGQTSTQ
ncbi:putative ornithine cyclodeaminase/mu-crystallin family protein (plasmid) [Phaeobacter inhibens]|nr:ornithine cyclodeaminase family protein [Phaeobacter inhibens]AUQ60723.1 putative ornithine cyclodeaminase/mu-crystallin family protein [Phaeobacter inhibens]